jgi:hypothetical protein
MGKYTWDDDQSARPESVGTESTRESTKLKLKNVVPVTSYAKFDSQHQSQKSQIPMKPSSPRSPRKNGPSFEYRKN